MRYQEYDQRDIIANESEIMQLPEMDEKLIEFNKAWEQVTQELAAGLKPMIRYSRFRNPDTLSYRELATVSILAKQCRDEYEKTLPVHIVEPLTTADFAAIHSLRERAIYISMTGAIDHSFVSDEEYEAEMKRRNQASNEGGSEHGNTR